MSSEENEKARERKREGDKLHMWRTCNRQFRWTVAGATDWADPRISLVSWLRDSFRGYSFMLLLPPESTALLSRPSKVCKNVTREGCMLYILSLFSFFSPQKPHVHLILNPERKHVL